MATYEVCVHLTNGKTVTATYHTLTRREAERRGMAIEGADYIIYIRCLTGFDPS